MGTLPERTLAQVSDFPSPSLGNHFCHQHCCLLDKFDVNWWVMVRQAWLIVRWRQGTLRDILFQIFIANFWLFPKLNLDLKVHCKSAMMLQSFQCSGVVQTTMRQPESPLGRRLHSLHSQTAPR